MAVRCTNWERSPLSKCAPDSHLQVWRYQMLYNTILTSWWWAQQCSKHVEVYNKLIIKKWFCASSWLYLQDYTRMHGQKKHKMWWDLTLDQLTSAHYFTLQQFVYEFLRSSLLDLIQQQGWQCTYNVTLGRVLGTNIVVEKQHVLLFSMRVRSLSYPACNAHAPYCHLCPSGL